MTTVDPLAELRAKLRATPKSDTSKPQPLPAPAAPAPVPLTGEHVFQRLRYFENLVDHLFKHQKTLVAQVSRTGTAPAAMPDFPVLRSLAGDFDPKKQ
jgi:hypothetical protein